MPTGTSSLRKTKRRGITLVAACAAALAAALIGPPAWAGPVPTARRSTGRAARPGIAADRGGADEGVVARGPDDSGRRNRGVDSDARCTPGGADDARDAKGECTYGRRQDEQGSRRRRRRAPRPRNPRRRTALRPIVSTAAPQPAPTHSSTTTGGTTRHVPAVTLRARRLRRGRKASRPTGERNEAGFAGARGCRGPTGREPPRPADRDADALVRRLRRGRTALAAAALLLVAAGAGGLVVGVAGRRLARIT